MGPLHSDLKSHKFHTAPVFEALLGVIAAGRRPNSVTASRLVVRKLERQGYRAVK